MGAPTGNTNARRGKLFTLALKREIAAAGDGDFLKGIDKVARTMVKAAIDGDMAAADKIADRLDGKPAQQVIATGMDDGPVEISELTPAERQTRAARLIALAAGRDDDEFDGGGTGPDAGVAGADAGSRAQDDAGGTGGAGPAAPDASGAG